MHELRHGVRVSAPRFVIGPSGTPRPLPGGLIRSFLVFLCLFVALPAACDTIYLTGGGRLDGVLVEEDDEQVIFDVIMGASKMRMSFSRGEVERIEIASAEEKEALEQERERERAELKRVEEEMRGRGLVLHRGEWRPEEELPQTEEPAEPAAARSLRPVAPGFEIEDLEGTVHSMHQYRGRPLLLFFLQTNSRPCAYQIPTMKRAQEKYRKEDLAVLGISLDADKEKVRNFAVARKVSFPILHDGEGWKSPVVKQYGVKRLPATYLIDRSGKIRAAGILGEYIDKEIGKMLNR